MSTCANCGETILFGGVKYGTLTFCRKRCFNNNPIVQIAVTLPEEEIQELVQKIHEGTCPICGGHGPVDIHSSCRVVSFLFATSYQTNQRISCRSCAAKANFTNGLISLLFGWWGIPWGILMTPFYLLRNFWGLICPVSTLEPSEKLKEHVRLMIAEKM
jgi:hypothetical protein